MRLKNVTVIGALLLGLGFTSCQEDQEVVQQNDISKETLDKIYQMGFGTKDVQRVDNGYLVEGDIYLSEKSLNDTHDPKFLRIGETEQYRTNNLVNAGNGRTITISISSRFTAAYVAGLDEAIRRYNTENLLIKFARVTTSGVTGEIDIVRGNGSYLASAGFPTSAGNPHNLIKVNQQAIGTAPNVDYIATILAHEIGHCIGFRHTDYTDRSYSCGGSTANEGASTVGAVYIPGTAVGPDPNSWMLACIGSGQSRPFNANDKTALNHLY